MTTHAPTIGIWAISAVTMAAIAFRPWRVGEWIWAVVGAAVLVATGLISGADAAAGAADGLDVYLFLAGMLALAELARIHGVFERVAAAIVSGAAGDAARLFTSIYVAGVIVTAVLSNDGTIVLLTPAVLAVTKRADLPRAPYLYACAFVANAASFVLPISNPANLVVFRNLPKLWPWLSAFGLPSLAAIVSTFIVLRYVFRRELGQRFTAVPETSLSNLYTRLALVVVAVAIAAIVAISGLGLPVGRTTFVAGATSVLVVRLADFGTPKDVLRETPWSIVPLVAGLFVIVQALDKTGVLSAARLFFRNAGAVPALEGHLLVGAAVTIADNLLNNLPVGVLTRYALHDNSIAGHVMNAALVGVDLGPNLSLTGSLATLLWLLMLRRENINVAPVTFLKTGVMVTIPALVLALLFVR